VVGRVCAGGFDVSALGSSLPTVVDRVRAGGRDVSALRVGCASRLAGTPGSSVQAGLHLLLVLVVLLDPLTAWLS
jgi:hypothetical protein